jgi:oligopeptide/dipeptide ABC transporter ATP-binding protein
MAVLEIENLEVRYRSGAAEAQAVKGVTLSVKSNECLGLIGESGCGKSTIAKAVMGLLPGTAYVAGGSIRFEGQELVGLAEEKLRKLRWKRMTLIPQAAMNGFDPLYTIQKQLHETIGAHEEVSEPEKRLRAERLFTQMGLSSTRLKDYPHQFSGGMRQRAMIAMALLCDPALIVADEPTTGLDVLVQDQILKAVIEDGVRAGKSILLITHDMGVVAENCDKIAVMYAGQIVEAGDNSLLQTARHPYTLGLSNAFPNLADQRRRLISIPGSPPDIFSPDSGCCFRKRCPFATARCLEEPPLVRVAPDHLVACHFVDRGEEFRRRASDAATWEGLNAL